MFDELERYRQRYLGFSAEEYRTRVSRLQERMVHSGMDGIIISQVENVLYFTGYRTWLKVSKHRPFVTVIPRSESRSCWFRIRRWVQPQRSPGYAISAAGGMEKTTQRCMETCCERRILIRRE